MRFELLGVLDVDVARAGGQPTRHRHAGPGGAQVSRLPGAAGGGANRLDDVADRQHEEFGVGDGADLMTSHPTIAARPCADQPLRPAFASVLGGYACAATVQRAACRIG